MKLFRTVQLTTRHGRKLYGRFRDGAFKARSAKTRSVATPRGSGNSLTTSFAWGAPGEVRNVNVQPPRLGQRLVAVWAMPGRDLLKQAERLYGGLAGRREKSSAEAGRDQNLGLENPHQAEASRRCSPPCRTTAILPAEFLAYAV